MFGSVSISLRAGDILEMRRRFARRRNAAPRGGRLLRPPLRQHLVRHVARPRPQSPAAHRSNPPPRSGPTSTDLPTCRIPTGAAHENPGPNRPGQNHRLHLQGQPRAAQSTQSQIQRKRQHHQLQLLRDALRPRLALHVHGT